MMHDEYYAADFLDCSAALMRRMRREGRGPKWTRVGRLIRYSDQWLREYVEGNSIPKSSHTTYEDQAAK